MKWLEAMKSEMGSMYENKVWTLVDLPDDRQAIENDSYHLIETSGRLCLYQVVSDFQVAR